MTISELRDLYGTVQTERAQAGIFLTLARPPATFGRYAVQAGLGDLRIPRLQVITIEELFAGVRPVTPAPRGVAQFEPGERQSIGVNQHQSGRRLGSA